MARQKPQGRPAGGARKPVTKEQAVQDMVKNNPEKAAQMLREILKNK